MWFICFGCSDVKPYFSLPLDVTVVVALQMIYCLSSNAVHVNNVRPRKVKFVRAREH